MASEERKPPRVLLTAFPDHFSLPVRPSASTAAVQDAHRQTNFLLRAELAEFEKLMNLQLRVVAAQSRTRGAHAAAILSFWSRAYMGLADACNLMTYGSYASCPPLLRTTLDCIAVQRSLVGDGFAEYEDWFPGGVSHLGAAVAFDLGRYRAASAVVSDERLGLLYRLLSDLTMPHLGSTLFLASPEAGLQKLPIGFADSSFHLGWAQLITGWLLHLAVVQLETALSAPDISIDKALRSDCEAAPRDLAHVLDDSRRCHAMEEDGHIVLHNFRRASTGQPKQIVLI